MISGEKMKTDMIRQLTGNEPDPDPMIEASFHPFHLNARSLQVLNHLFSQFRAAPAGIFELIIVRGEAVEVINEISLFCNIDLEGGRAALPMSGECYNRFGFDSGGDFIPHLGELSICWMACVFHKIRTTDTKEVCWQTRLGGRCHHEKLESDVLFAAR